VLEALKIKEKDCLRDCVAEKGGGPSLGAGTGWVEESWVLGLLWVSGNL
jgi:hypothetical protein